MNMKLIWCDIQNSIDADPSESTMGRWTSLPRSQENRRSRSSGDCLSVGVMCIIWGILSKCALLPENGYQKSLEQRSHPLSVTIEAMTRRLMQLSLTSSLQLRSDSVMEWSRLVAKTTVCIVLSSRCCAVSKLWTNVPALSTITRELPIIAIDHLLADLSRRLAKTAVSTVLLRRVDTHTTH